MSWFVSLQPARFLAAVVFCLSILVLTGCAANIHWVKEPATPSACLPDHPPTWSDYSRKSRNGSPDAQTAVRFGVAPSSSPRLMVVLDPEASWVKPEAANSWNPLRWLASETLLRHEQVHFAISCLLTRQANRSLQTGGDLMSMLELLKATAQRINMQYDADTQHGTQYGPQRAWEQEVERQLEEVTKKAERE